MLIIIRLNLLRCVFRTRLATYKCAYGAAFVKYRIEKDNRDVSKLMFAIWLSGRFFVNFDIFLLYFVFLPIHFSIFISHRCCGSITVDIETLLRTFNVEGKI